MSQEQVDKIKKGYANLQYNFERTEVRNFIEEYEKANEDQKKSLVAKLTSVKGSLGPLAGNACPCCGKV